jgi:hypothetical protein
VAGCKKFKIRAVASEDSELNVSSDFDFVCSEAGSPARARPHARLV